MKLIGKHIDRDGSVSAGRPYLSCKWLKIYYQGRVTIRPEDDEDMWHLYNLIQEVTRIRLARARTM